MFRSKNSLICSNDLTQLFKIRLVALSSFEINKKGIYFSTTANDELPELDKDGNLKPIDGRKKKRLTPTDLLKTKKYNTKMASILKLGQMEKFGDLVNEMDTKNISQDTVSYNTIISFFAKQNNIQEALTWFRDMGKKKDSNIVPDKTTYSTLIAAFGRLGKFNESVTLLQQMFSKKRKTHRLSLTAINDMFETYTGNYQNTMNMEKGVNWLNVPALFKLQPNIRTYSILMNWFSTNNMRRELYECYNSLMKTQTRLTRLRDTKNYNALMKPFAMVGDSERVNQLFSDMKRKHMAPDVESITIIITSCLQAQDFEKAIEWFKNLLSSSLAPLKEETVQEIENLFAKYLLRDQNDIDIERKNNPKIIISEKKKPDPRNQNPKLLKLRQTVEEDEDIVFTMNNERRFSEALELMKFVKKTTGFSANSIFYEKLIFYQIEVLKEDDKAWKSLLFSVEKYQLIPTLDTFSLLFKNLQTYSELTEENIKKFNFLKKLLKDNSINPNLDILNSQIFHYARTGDSKSISFVWDKIYTTPSVYPNVDTYYFSIILGHLRNNNLEKAIKIFKKFKTDEILKISIKSKIEEEKIMEIHIELLKRCETDPGYQKKIINSLKEQNLKLEIDNKVLDTL